MYRDAYDELREQGAKVRRRDELRARRKAAEQELSRARSVLEAAERLEAKGARDVGKPARARLTRVLWAVVGRTDRELDAHVDADATRLPVQAARADAERASAVLDEIDDELARLADVDARYTEAFIGKTARILAGDDDVATRVRALAEDVARAAGQLREIDDAIAAGRWVQRHLAQTQEAIAALDDARSSARTTRLGTLFTAKAKRAPDTHRLGESLEQAQAWVERFLAELRHLERDEAVDAVAPHGPLLSRYVALLRGRSQALGQRARQTIDAARATIDETVAALESERPPAAQRHARARADYRAAVENA